MHRTITSAILKFISKFMHLMFSMTIINNLHHNVKVRGWWWNGKVSAEWLSKDVTVRVASLPNLVICFA